MKKIIEKKVMLKDKQIKCLYKNPIYDNKKFYYSFTLLSTKMHTHSTLRSIGKQIPLIKYLEHGQIVQNLNKQDNEKI